MTQIYGIFFPWHGPWKKSVTISLCHHSRSLNRTAAIHRPSGLFKPYHPQMAHPASSRIGIVRDHRTGQKGRTPPGLVQADHRWTRSESYNGRSGHLGISLCYEASDPWRSRPPGSVMRSLTSSLNKKGKRLLRPAKWLMQFPQTQYTLSFNDENWSSCREEDPNSDLKITTTEIWATVFTAPRSDRSRLAKAIEIDGAPDRIDEFLQTFGIQDQENRPVLDSIDTGNKRKKPKLTKERKE